MIPNLYSDAGEKAETEIGFWFQNEVLFVFWDNL